MAEGKICVCPQCGKKFKLKADFASKSFACTGCGATVWVEGKPAGPSSPRGKRSAPARGAAGRGAAAKRGGRAPAARTGGGGGGRGQRRGRNAPPPDEEEGGRRGRYQQPKNNSQNVIIAVVGLVIVIGAVAFFLMKGDDKKPGTGDTTATGTNTPGMTDTGSGNTGAVGDATDGETGGKPEGDGEAAATDGQTPEGDGEPKADGETEPKTDGEAAGDTNPLKADGKAKTRTEIRDGKEVKVRISKWNPPDDIGHLESTPEDQRKEIDELIKVMFDPDAGRDSFDAKQKLAQIGKPAYLPILAAMHKAQATFKWDPNDIDENLAMSSIKLADECLRMMDGYLEANGIGVIRPGTDEKYYGYVIRMHYKRWKQTLEGLDKMPGPFDPSTEYEKETETADD